MVKRFTEQVQITPQNISTGAASGQMALADKLSAFGQQIDRNAANLGAKLGAKEAQEVEIQRDPETGRVVAPEKRKAGVADILLTGGARTQAFNKTVRDGYLAGLENDSRVELAKIEQENPDNIAAYNDSVEGLKKGILEGVDPAARNAVGQFLDNQIASARIRVQGKSLQKAEDASNATIREAIDRGADDAARFARNGDAQAAAESMRDTFAHIDGMVETGAKSSDRAAEEKQEIRREVEEQNINRNVHGIADKDGTQAAFDEIQAIKKEVPKNWTPDQWDAYTDGLQADIVRMRSIDQAKKKEDLTLAKDALKDYQKAKSIGFDVSPKETRRVEKLVSQDAGLQEAFNLTNQVASFALLSAEERRAALNTMETGELDDVDLFAASAKANAQINKMAAEDGYNLGVNQGLVKKTDFDMSNPDTLTVRVNDAARLSQHYGVEVSPLTDSEAQMVADSLETMTPAEKVVVANTLSVAPALWGKLSEKNAGSFAMAGATGDGNVMRGVFKGQQLIQEGLVKLPSDKDMLTTFEDEVGDSLGTRDKSDLFKAVKDYYATVTTDPTGSNIDDNALEDAIQAVSGGISEINGFKTVLPRGVDDDDFEDLFDDMSPKTVGSLGGVFGLSDEEAVEIIEDSRIVGIKDGQYILENDGGTLMSKADPRKPFVVEWSNDVAAQNKAFSASERSARRRSARSRGR